MIVDYETSVRYAHLYTTEINNVIRKADHEMKKVLSKDFVGFMLLPSKDPAAKPVLIPAFYRNKQSDNASFVGKSGIYKAFIQQTDTGNVLELVADGSNGKENEKK